MAYGGRPPRVSTTPQADSNARGAGKDGPAMGSKPTPPVEGPTRPYVRPHKPNAGRVFPPDVALPTRRTAETPGKTGATAASGKWGRKPGPTETN